MTARRCHRNAKARLSVRVNAWSGLPRPRCYASRDTSQALRVSLCQR